MAKEEKNVKDASISEIGNGKLLGVVDGILKHIETDKSGGLMTFDKGVSKSDINVEGGVTGFNPIGQVVEGDKRAVSGEEVYESLIPKYFDNIGYVNKLNGAVDFSVSSLNNYSHTFFLKIKDKSNLRVTGYSGASNFPALVSFYDINCNYLSRYNADVTGSVIDHLVPESTIPADAVYVRASRLTSEEGSVSGVFLDASIVSYEFKPILNIFSNIGYINKLNGYIVKDDGYRFSIFLKLINRKNLRVKGFSGATNNTSLVAFYDSSFKWIGSYNATTAGPVSNHLVPESSIPENTYYVVVGDNVSSGLLVSVTSVEIPNYTNSDLVSLNEVEFKGNLDNIFNDGNNGYVNKNSGIIIESNGYNYSNYLTIEDKSNLRVTGYSGVSNNVALVSFYDADFIFIGYYNATTAGNVSNHLVPESSIPTDTKYIRYTKASAQSVLVQNAYRSYTYELNDMANLIKSYKDPFFKISESDIFKSNGYVDKTTGMEIEQSSYQYSYYLILTNRSNLRVNGYSGVSNNVALVSFYDADFIFIGYYNSTTAGNVSNHLVPESSIPENTFYIRVTKRDTQAFGIEGVSSTFKVKELIDFIENKKQNSDGYTRSGKPNPDKGGYLKFSNYLGNDQNIHPKVLFFTEAWNGYRYWMAYTPYPGGQVEHENPCIAASVDGMAWITPDGLINPLEFRPTTPERPSAYNSDTHLVYNDDTQQLECWWRSYDPSTSEVCIKRRVSSDGLAWQPTEIIFDWVNDGQLSQSVIYEDGVYKYWACKSGNIIYTESEDVFNFPAFSTLPIAFASNGLNAWHMDVIKTPKGLEFAVQCWVIGVGNNNTSDLYYVLYDGSTYSEPKLIVERGDLPTDDDYMGIYRASIVWHPYNANTPRMGGYYFIYYSALGRNYSNRNIFLTSGRGVDRLRGVNL